MDGPSTRSALLSLALLACAGDPIARDAGADGGTDAVVPVDALVCPATRGAFLSLVYVDPGAPDFQCTSRDPTNAEIVRNARVTGVSTDLHRLELDFCGPAANCTPQLGSFEIANADVRFGQTTMIAPDQFLEIHWRIRSPYGRGCTREIEIRNLDVWDGVANPVRDDRWMLFAAADASDASLPDEAVTVSRVPIGCADPGTFCMGAREGFSLSFAVNGHTQIVPQGTSASLPLDGLHGYAVTNVSSFVTGDCDDPGAFAWTVEAVDYEFP